MTDTGMRVLLLSDWMTESGGSEVYMTSVRQALRAAGDEVLLLTCGAGEAGAGVADARIWGTDRVAPQVLLQVANPFAARRVRAVVGGFRPQVALVGPFAYHLSPSVMAALGSVPTVLSVMDYKLICPLGSKLLPDGAICDRQAGLVCWRRGCLSLPHWVRDRARYARLHRARDRAHTVLVASRAVRDVLAAHGIASQVLPLPVASPGPSPPRRPAPAPAFLYCGRLSREKGVHLLLRAFARARARVPDASLRLVGDGALRPQLERLVRELQLDDAVAFRGQLPFERVEQELADAWALVAPSLWAEPFGLVAPEAILRHVPVIASRTGGFADTVVDGVTGLLVPNGDETALADAMISVAERHRFGTHVLPVDAVAALAREHDEARYVERLHAVFAGVVDGTRGTARGDA